MLAIRPSSSSSMMSLSVSPSLSLGVLKSRRTKAMRKMPRKANCAQKSTTPKKGKLTMMRLRKVLATEGVQTRLADPFSARSVHGTILFLLWEQSGCSPGCLGGRSQKVCGPKVEYCGATIIVTA